MVQWLRICLPMQGTRVRALVWEDPTCCGATRPVSHNYWACVSGACAPNKRGRDSERPANRDEQWPPLATTRESPRIETKTQHSQKKKECRNIWHINKWMLLFYFMRRTGSTSRLRWTRATNLCSNPNSPTRHCMTSASYLANLSFRFFTSKSDRITPTFLGC